MTLIYRTLIGNIIYMCTLHWTWWEWTVSSDLQQISIIMLIMFINVSEWVSGYCTCVTVITIPGISMTLLFCRKCSVEFLFLHFRYGEGWVYIWQGRQLWCVFQWNFSSSEEPVFPSLQQSSFQANPGNVCPEYVLHGTIPLVRTPIS